MRENEQFQAIVNMHSKYICTIGLQEGWQKTDRQTDRDSALGFLLDPVPRLPLSKLTDPCLNPLSPELPAV